MKLPRARPLVRLHSKDPPAEVEARFRAALAKEGCRVVGDMVPGHLSLHMRESEQHFWSPWLALELRPDGEGTRASGRFGPHAHVWTGFMFVYAVITVAGIGLFSWGWAQWAMGEPALALWGLPAAGALAAFVFGAEMIGKGLGNEQMWVVRDFVRDVVELCPRLEEGGSGEAAEDAAEQDPGAAPPPA